jgi:sulfonate transport system ATP-binding protein
VLQDIDLQVRAGEFISIVGASGCGKSTLLRLVLGMDVDYEGDPLGDERITAPGLDRGIVFQDHRLFPGSRWSRTLPWVCATPTAARPKSAS